MQKHNTILREARSGQRCDQERDKIMFHAGYIIMPMRARKVALAQFGPHAHILAMSCSIRLAVRGLLLHEDRLLLVNAYGGRSDIWCAPGGGAELHQSLPENLAREIFEETGLEVSVETPCLVNEFHDPDGAFHQVDIFFRCSLLGGALSDSWQDPEGVVNYRRWVNREEIKTLDVRPKSLAQVAWDNDLRIKYDPLEPILR